MESKFVLSVLLQDTYFTLSMFLSFLSWKPIKILKIIFNMDQLWFYLEALRHVLWNKKLLGHGLEELTTFTPVALNIIPSYDDTRGAWVLRLCLNRVLAHHRWVTKETLTNVRYMAAICSQLHTHSRFTTEHNMVAYPEKNSKHDHAYFDKNFSFKSYSCSSTYIYNGFIKSL